MKMPTPIDRSDKEEKRVWKAVENEPSCQSDVCIYAIRKSGVDLKTTMSKTPQCASFLVKLDSKVREELLKEIAFAHPEFDIFDDNKTMTRMGYFRNVGYGPNRLRLFRKHNTDIFKLSTRYDVPVAVGGLLAGIGLLGFLGFSTLLSSKKQKRMTILKNIPEYPWVTIKTYTLPNPDILKHLKPTTLTKEDQSTFYSRKLIDDKDKKSILYLKSSSQEVDPFKDIPSEIVSPENLEIAITCDTPTLTQEKNQDKGDVNPMSNVRKRKGKVAQKTNKQSQYSTINKNTSQEETVSKLVEEHEKTIKDKNRISFKSWGKIRNRTILILGNYDENQLKKIYKDHFQIREAKRALSTIAVKHNQAGLKCFSGDFFELKTMGKSGGIRSFGGRLFSSTKSRDIMYLSLYKHSFLERTARKK